MVPLRKKNIKGHIYWYAIEMARVDGKPRQVWQKYLGTAEKIVELKERATGLPHIKLTSFQYGKTAALLAISENAMQKWFDKSTLSLLWKFPHKLTC